MLGKNAARPDVEDGLPQFKNARSGRLASGSSLKPVSGLANLPTHDQISSAVSIANTFWTGRAPDLNIE